MEKKANTYKLSSNEKAILKSLIDKRYGSITTPSDYDSFGDYDTGVEAAVFAATGQLLSGSTMERLVGLRDENRGVRKITLEIIAKYLKLRSIKQLFNTIANIARNGLEEKTRFSNFDIFKKHIVKIKFGDKEVHMEYLFDEKFQIIYSNNPILLRGDFARIAQLEVGKELKYYFVARVEKDKLELLGGYSSGILNKVSEICFSAINAYKL